MKQKLLKSILLLCALVVGNGSLRAADTWVKTDPTALSSGDIVVIVDLTSGKAMSNDKGTSSAPSATAVTLNTDKDEITSEVAATLQWTVTASGSGESRTYQFAKGTDFLYVIKNNNGVRVGEGVRNSFTIVKGGDNNGYYLYNYDSEALDARNVGCYNESDWRCYTSINANIKGNNNAFFKKVTEVSYTITAVSNNNEWGTVSVLGNAITATPKEGYIIDKTTPYEVTSGTASIAQSSNVFTVTADADCTIKINFAVAPKYDVKWSVNGVIVSTDKVDENSAITFTDPTSGIPAGYVFKGWVEEANKIDVPTDTDPKDNYIASATCTDNVTYYAVLAVATEGEEVSTLTQTLTYDSSDSYPWEIGGSNTDKSSYTLLHTGGYVKSASFDLSKLSQVKVYGGTFGGSTYNSFTIDDGTNIWKSGTLSGTGNAKEHSFTDGTALTGTGALYITSTCGTSSGSGIRISKVEIFTMAPAVIYKNYCTTVPAATITLASACTDGDKYYGTYSNNSAFIVPADLTVSAITSADGGKLTTSDYAEGDIVKANTGVLVSSTTAGEKTVVLTAATGTEISGNMLKASGDAGIDAAGMDEANTKFYRLTMHNGTQIGFWWGAENGAAFAVAANKAYLAVPNGSGAREGLWFNDDVTTGINAVENGETVKAVYNLAGQRVAQPTRGLYIVNGKKIVIK